MIYHFGDFELDTLKAELRRRGDEVALEPQVFALLILLAENAERLVSKDEIVEKVWDGRFVSDSAIASRVKSLRAALGDDGKAQKYIRTVHGKGFRFVGELRQSASSVANVIARGASPGAAEPSGGRPSIAVLPFRLIGVAGEFGGVAEALPDELIAVLARLRWLFVIARGSAFRFRPPAQDIVEIGAALNVGYCLTGAIEILGDKIVVAVELAETTQGGVVWGERFRGALDDIHSIREEIIAAVVAALEINIPVNEANAARLKSPDRIDAWSAYHLGLQHLHRFNARDNEAALSLFERAIGIDPAFARAHAGLSSAHFQNAFMHYRSDRPAIAIAARRHAERAVELDPLDPMANFVMGRVSWIEDDVPAGAGWLDRAVTLSPNYAQGVYARAWMKSITGEGGVPHDDINLALSLSPLDPFRYAMLGVRAFCHLTDGDDAMAARFADEAARAPGAHVLIAAIALALNEIAGERTRAKTWAENVRGRNPAMTQAHFFEAFPFPPGVLRTRISRALKANGF